MPISRSDRILIKIFEHHYNDGNEEFTFNRDEIEAVCKEMKLESLLNLGDFIYTYRFRKELPDKIKKTAQKDKEWIIELAGRSVYKFKQVRMARIIPNANMVEIKIPDSTPGMILRYALDDEQSTLAKLRYNRIVDLFTGVTCYSLQNHLRTTVQGIGQIEIDELYVGVDKSGIHYMFPVEAKSLAINDNLGIVQINQDLEYCNQKFPGLRAYAIGAKMIELNKIALFAFEYSSDGPKILREIHYRLVPHEEITEAELELYKQRPLPNSL